MPKGKNGVLHIGKALMGVPCATLAAMGSATGVPWLAGLAVIPATALIAFDTIDTYLTKQKIEKHPEVVLELPPPAWWTTDVRAWQDLCIEIEDHLPTILHDLAKRIQKVQGVVTTQTVQQLFADSFTAESLTWASDPGERRQVAEFIGAPLLQKLGETLNPVIEQIQRETSLIDTHKTALSTEKTVSVLEEIRDAHKPHTFNENEIAALRQHYCNDVYERWKMLDFRGIMHVEMHRPMGIPLTEVFISPDVMVGAPESEALEREEELKSEGKRPQEAQDYQGNKTAWQAEQYKQAKREKQVAHQREALSAILGKRRHLVILGHPGAGKSTLLRYFMLRLAHDSEAFAEDFPYLTDVSLAIPFYIPLASYAEYRRSNPCGDRSLKQFLPRHLSENNLESYSGFLQNQLEQGRVFLLLDGLDEIPDAAFRATIVQQIEAFTQSYSQNHFIVTSRIVGYKEAPLAADYQPYTLADFNQQQIETFTQKWCPAYEAWVRGTTDRHILHEAATTDAERLFQATQRNPGVKKLAVNPLLLTILALIQRQGIELPSHRVELFFRCTETLLDTWITAKGQALSFSKTQLVKILRPLAFWMHQQRTVGAIPEDDLTEQIVKQLLDRKISTDESEALKLAEAFLKTVRGRTGILVERGKERYGFLHQAFEEYFAARELEIRPDRNDFIKQHLHEARWREVILLTVGAIGILHSNEEGATELVQDVIMQAQSPFEEWLHRDLLFAGLCLADDVGVSVTCENEIVEEIVLLYLTSPYDSLRDASADVLSEWNGTPIGKKAAHLILSTFRKQEILTGKATTATTLQPLEISFQEKLQEYYQRILQRTSQGLSCFICLQIIMLLHRLRIEQEIIPNPVEYSLNLLSDPFYVVREAAASLLGQLGMSRPDVIEGLMKILSDPVEDVRKSAVSALGQLSSGNSDGPEIVKALLPTLTDPHENVRQAAVLALREASNTQPEVIEALLHTLSDSNIYVCQASVKALGQLSNLQPAITETLIHALATSDQRIRKGIAEILGELSNVHPRIIEILLHTLLDPNDDVRQAAIASLGRLGAAQNPVILDTLLLALSNRSWQIRLAAAIALGQLGNSQWEVVKTLTRALSDVAEDVRLAAATALGQLRSSQPEMMELLLHASSLDIRQTAAIALGHSGNTQPEVIEALLHMLSDSSWRIRQATTAALGHSGNTQPEVIEALLHILSDASWQVRQTAVKALEQLGCTQLEVTQALLNMFSDPHSKVRQAAATALGQLGNSQPEVVKMLLHTLSDANDDVRLATITALGYSSNAQSEIIEALLDAFSDPNDNISQAAITALGCLETTQPSIVSYLLATLSDAANLRLPQKSLNQLQQEFYKGFTQRQVKLLGEIGTGYEQVVDLLLHAISDTTEQKEVRQTIAITLGQLENPRPEVIEALLHTLTNTAEDTKLRQTVATALGQLENPHPEVVETLLHTLTNTAEDTKLRQAVAIALGQLENPRPEVVETLLHTLTNSDNLLRWRIVTALDQLGVTQPRVIDSLLLLLSDSYSSVREASASALRKIAATQPSLFDSLVHSLPDSPSNTNDTAITLITLGLTGNSKSEVIKPLLHDISGTDRFSRWEAVKALGQAGNAQPEVVQALLHALSDTDQSIRREAVKALGQAGNAQPEVVQALLHALSDIDRSIRREAAKALGQVGNSQPEVVQALLHALSDTDGLTRRAAAFSLANLRVDRVACSSSIQGLLQKASAFARDRLEVDDIIDDLLFALYQIIEKV